MSTMATEAANASRLLSAELNRHGATVDPFNHAVASVTELRRRYQERAHHDLVDRTLEALVDNRDPAEDPAVQAAATSHVLAHHVADATIQARAVETVCKVAAEHMDEILAALRQPFDAAATEMMDLRHLVADLDLSDVAVAHQRGPDASAALSRAAVLNREIARIASGWAAAHTLARPGRLVAAHVAVFGWVDPDPAAWAKLPVAYRPASAWEALEEHRLSLATLAEFDARQEAVTKARADWNEAVSASADAATKMAVAMRFGHGRPPEVVTL